MNVCMTVDLEPDCPPYLTSHRGIDEGLGHLVETLADYNIPATFFCTGAVARRNPHIIEELVTGGYEIGCHGDTHRKFDHLSYEEARREIQDSTACLRKLYPVTSFRAPNLRFPLKYMPLLEAEGYTVDSSQGRHKSLTAEVTSYGNILRVPASTTSSVLRLPRRMRNFILGRCRSPAVLFVHPWEFVDFTKSNLRLDCRFNTGPKALRALEDTISFFRKRGAVFLTIRELAGIHD